MKDNFLYKSIFILFILGLTITTGLQASSHREAPLIANDPLADNTDVYAFRSPDDPDMITIIASYVPLQLPHGGPNYYSFGENIRYEIHIDNDASVPGDEIIYRFTFQQTNEDPNTFFNIRLGQQNLKTSYQLERSIDGGNSFVTIITFAEGTVPPPNIGPRSIEDPVVGLNTTYDALFNAAIETASTNEKVFCGTTDDPFFVDLGGIFDLGDAPRQDGDAQDGVQCFNVSSIAIQIPISTLLKSSAPANPTSILDPDYVIGVWASASRPAMRTLSSDDDPMYSGDWVQVSRLGMPLTNEAVIPIGQKDFWNAISPYDEITDVTLDNNFYNPELGLYMDDDLFGGAVPAFSPLRIQRNSLQGFDFGNGQTGLFDLKGTPAVDGTALAEPPNGFGHVLLPADNSPRSVDLWPIFHTGVPNARPYQLATGKAGDPLAAGKPFIHNFLPNGGDMLRLNMAVPATPRNDPAFSSLGLIAAAVAGLTDPTYNGDASLQAIPNMDGFPNGRRLEDDVTRIELQAVGGVVLAAIGLWYDDYTAGDPNPVTQDLLDVLTYSTGVESNDEVFTSSFPYLAQPHRGTDACERISLPLALSVFNGYVLKETNKLEWVTATEQNIQWHVVERSEDGKNNWTEIGRVSSKGPSVSTKYYELEDKKPIAAAYYRLRSIDTSSKSQFSSQVFLSRGQEVVWSVQPNPAQGSFEITGDFGKTKEAYIVVMNVLGKVVSQQQVSLTAGQLSTRLDCSTWIPGMYFVNMVMDGQRVVKKVEVH